MTGRDVTPVSKQPSTKKTPKRLNPIGKKSRLVDDVWKAARAAVMERCGGQCEYFMDAPLTHFTCAARATEVHHRLPTGRGGKHDLDNLVALCVPHHRHIHAYQEKSIAAGWIVKTVAP